jgi:hypothetical protein
MTVIVIGLDADGVTTATQTGELEPDSAASSESSAAGASNHREHHGDGREARHEPGPQSRSREYVRDASSDSWIESASRLRSGSSEPRTHAIARTVLPAWLMWTLGGATAALTIVALVLAWVIWLGPARDAGTPTTPTPKDAHVPAKEGRS